MSVARGLVGDIGGTHARFALAELRDGKTVLIEPRTYEDRDHPTLLAAVKAYLGEVGGERPRQAVLAVAGPVTGGAVAFTNARWTLSETELKAEAGFASARLINDFTAQAHGAPRLGPEGLQRIGAEAAGEPGGSIAVLGPGTGFGVGGLIREQDRAAAVSGEGGHITFAPCDELEVEILRRLVREHGRVSVERLLSGPGLHDLYRTLADIDGAPASLPDERAVQAAAEAGDPLAARAVERFCMILGATAGDIALVMGARGGVYVTGGVAQKLAGWIAKGGFRTRFEDKGRFQGYMRAIPTWLIVEPYAALIGAASLLCELETAA
jgi:glucokinase